MFKVKNYYWVIQIYQHQMFWNKKITKKLYSITWLIIKDKLVVYVKNKIYRNNFGLFWINHRNKIIRKDGNWDRLQEI